MPNSDAVFMAIYLPGTVEEEQLALDDLTPREIVSELDKYVLGQKDAKRAVAIALRNRMRRQKLAPDLAEEIIPKNIIMIGPTGVGKTELSKQLAHCLGVPFLRFDMSEYSERHTISRLIGAPPGYVGFEQSGLLTDAVLKTHQLAFSEGGGFQVYRSGLRGPRCGIYGARPGRDCHRHGARGEVGRRIGQGRVECRGAFARHSAAAHAVVIPFSRTGRRGCH